MRLEDGETLENACWLCGISFPQVQRLMINGKYNIQDALENGSPLSREGEIYMMIRSSIAVWKSEFRKKLLECGDWRAGMAFYERQNAEDFGKKQVIQMEHENRLVIEIQSATGEGWQKVRGGTTQEIIETTFNDKAIESGDE